MQDTSQTSDEGVLLSEFVLSHVEAVLAGTLALMTALAQGCCDNHRHALRQKVIANLSELEQHAALSQQFRAVASNLQRQWCALDSGSAPRTAQDPKLWHPTPQAVQ